MSNEKSRSVHDVLRERVHQELKAMEQIGMKIPEGAYDRVNALTDDELDSMSTADAADLCVNLSQLS